MNLLKQSPLRQIKGTVGESGMCTALHCYCSNEVNTSVFVGIVNTLENPWH